MGWQSGGRAVYSAGVRPALDWDEMSASERQKVSGEVQVGGYRMKIENDTDRLLVDMIADLPLQEWGWFVDAKAGERKGGFSGHVRALFEKRDKRPCASLVSVDWPALEERVGEAARGIVQQSLRNPGEIDAFKLYLASRGEKTKARPHHAYAIGQGGEIELL